MTPDERRQRDRKESWAIFVLWAIMAMAFLGACPGRCLGQATVRYGLVTREAAALAARDWNLGSPNERGYCVTRWARGAFPQAPSDSGYFVWRIVPAEPNASSPDSLVMHCGVAVPRLHTHPCDTLACDCNPSRNDLWNLTVTKAPFGVVQCGARQFVFFFPPLGTPRPDTILPHASAYPTSEGATVAFIGASAAFVLSNAIWHWDQDVGGYADIWYPQKQYIHFSLALGIVAVASAIHVNPLLAAGVTCVGGVGYEVTQGFVNRHDIAANCVGAAAGALLVHFLR